MLYSIHHTHTEHGPNQTYGQVGPSRWRIPERIARVDGTELVEARETREHALRVACVYAQSAQLNAAEVLWK